MKKISLSIFFMVLFTLSFGQTFDAELINYKTDIAVTNNNLVINKSYEIKICNRNGEHFSEISIPFSKNHKISKLEAVIKDRWGQVVRKLKTNEIVERSNISNFSLYEDDFVKEFTLKHNEYPYYICYSYQILETEFLEIQNWIPVLDSEIPTKNAELTLVTPKDYLIRYRCQYVDKPTIDPSEKTTTYHWKSDYNQQLKREKLAPPLTEFLPSVIIIPQDFKYVIKGNFQDWKSYSTWAFQLMKDKDQLTENEKIKITNIASGITDKTEKIKTLYHYLQDNTRYINVTINKGGIVPYPASYVCENKYGDCKALTNYFNSILNFMGIKSYYTLVQAGNVLPKTDNNFPVDNFNHIITYIPLENDTIWLDCTSKGPFNYLGTFTQNRDALSIDATNGALVHTPKLSPDDVLEIRNIEVQAEIFLPTKITFKNKYKGSMFEDIRQLNSSYNEKERDDILRKYFIHDGLEMIDYKIDKTERDSKSIQFNYTASSKNIYKKYGNEIVVNNIAFDVPDIEKPTERKFPIQINYPINRLDTILFHLPIGYTLSKKPQNISITACPYGKYSIKFIENEKTILVIKEMLINAGYYPIEEYSQFYDFCNKILNIEKTKHIILKPQD